MSPREAFKFGFLLKCAEEGLSPTETQQRVRQALQQLRQPLEPEKVAALKDLPGWITGKLMLLGGLPLAAGGVAGAGAGYLAAKMNAPDTDPDEAKLQELIITYQQQADQARRAAARHTYRAAAPTITGPRLVA